MMLRTYVINLIFNITYKIVIKVPNYINILYYNKIIIPLVDVTEIQFVLIEFKFARVESCKNPTWRSVPWNVI